MRITITLLAFSILCFGNYFAQGTWTFAAPTDGSGSSTAETGRSICTDASGNTYIMGVFNGAGVATDFDLNNSSLNTFTASTNDGFIASYDKNGNFRWKTIVSGTGSDFGAPSGGICTNGTFVWVAGSANVSAGAPTIMSSTNTVTITSPGTGVDAFVAKMNCSNGAVQWQQGFGGTGANDFAMGICVDPSGCVYVSGAYSSTFTLGSVTFPAFVGTISDIYIAKFTPSGVLRSVQTGGSTVQDFVNAGSGICYVPGSTPAIVATGHTGASTASFGTYTGLTNTGILDACLVELDTALTGFTNALVFGSTGSDELLSAVYDPFSGGVFVSGFASGNITFPGTAALTGLGLQDIVIARYSVATNNFVWSSNAGGAANDRGWCVTADGYGGILLSGHSAGACAFSGSVSMPANAGLNDLFVTRYSTSGTPLWVLPATGAGSEEARGIASYVETTPVYTQNVFVTGITNTTGVSFGSFPVGCDGGNDFYLAKLTDASAPLTATQSQVNLTCNGICNGSATVVASGGMAPYTYSWSPSGGSGATASSLCAGSYTCTITDAATASITKTFNLTQPTAIVLNANTQTNVSCFGGSNGAASVTAATGGTGGFTYNWTPGNPTGDGTVSVTGLTAGTYTCTVTDANACTATRTFNITQPTAIVATPASQTNISCFGGSNGAASINTPTGGAGGYTYNWTPGNPTGDGTVSVTGLTAGTWTCNVTDANSCTATRTFNITQPTAIVVTPASQTNISCFGGSNGAASINTPTGGAGGFTYNWTPGNPTGDGTVSVTGLTAGSWTCTVTDANSCTATQTFNVTQPPAIVVTPASQTNISCFGGSNGSASINTPTGGAGGFTYNWTPGNPTGDGTVSVTGLTAGSWTCTVTDANSCTATQTFNITQPPAIVVTPASQTNISCFGGSNGAASINTPTGGAGGYTYNWTPGNPTGDGTVSVTGLTNGVWTCTVTDANSCTATQTFNITQPTAIVVTPASQTNISCFGGSNGAASINTPTGGAGGYTYNWTPGNPTGDGTVSVTGLTTGAWTCTVTDANSCTATQTFNITQPTAIVVTPASQTNISCFGGSNGSASINTPTGGSGGFTYNWTPGNPTGDGTVSVTGLSAGTWTCTVTDANSCTATQTFNITQPTAIVVTPASQTNISCFGGSNGSASINTPTGGAGGFTYNWTPGNPTGDGTVSVTGLSAGSWTCTVTDANSCTATQTFNITQPTAIVVIPASQTNISCNGGTNGAASINTPTGGAGGYTYNWTPGNPTGDGTVSVAGLSAGSWTCTVTDANSCTATQTFNITQPTAITASISSTTTSCIANTGTATVSSVSGGAGGYTYVWTPSGGTAATATSLGLGNYTCTITDANSCSITRTVNVTTAAGPSLTAASQTNVSCFGGSNGAASVNAATGGSSPYTYNWTPGNPTGDGTISVTGLTAGIWTCTVTDAIGCTANQTFNITQPTAIVVTPATQTNISCFGGSNGSASINTPTGGTGGYTYNWTPGNPTGDGTVSVTGLIAGVWTCTVTDANSCTANQTFNITQPSALIVTPASQTNIACFGGSNGAASINTPTGGTGGYTYNWTPGNPTGDGTVSVTGLTAGGWTCTVTDANSCTATQTFNVTQPSPLVVTPASQTNVSCFGGNNGAASINTPTGGAGGYSYDWTPGNPAGDGTTSVTGLTAGTWTCTVTDANSCTASTIFTLIASDVIPPIAVCQNSTVYLNGAGNATITASNIDGGSSDNCGSISLSASQTSFNCLNLGANSITLTVTDASLNTSTCVATVTILDTLAPVVVCPGNQTETASGTCDFVLPDYTSLATVSDNCGSVTVTQAPASGNVITGNTTIILTATDPNGNSSTCSFDVILTGGGVTTAVCQNTTIYLDASGNASITATNIDGGSSSTCGAITISASQTNFTCADLGANTVTLTVTGSGGTETCTAIVTVTDTIAPTASNLATLQVECNDDAIVDLTVVNDEADNCGIPTVTFVSDVSDGQTCPETITRTYNVADANGNSLNLTQTIIIHDLTPPTAPTPATLSAQCSNTVPAPLVSWVSGEVDNCSTTTVSWVSDQSNGQSCPETITRTFSVTDACDNSINVNQSIIVMDTEVPTADVATLPELTANCDFTPTAPTATDNCEGSIDATADVAFPITGFGTTTVTWTYEDACGNTSTQTQVVTITPIDVTTYMANDGITFVVNNLGQTYQWIDCNTGQPIAGATNHNYTPTYGSDFAVIITQNGCSDTSDCINSTVGITEIGMKSLTLYPNPTDGLMFIDFKGDIKKIEVLDMLGRIVQTPVSIGNKSIDAASLATGKYLLRITTDNDQIILEEFVVKQ